MKIRPYRPADLEEMVALFCETVRRVNARDYAPAQLEAWASGADLARWRLSLQGHRCLVALDGDVIVGFADMDRRGYLGRLFVHADFQRQGIATALCQQLEQAAPGRIYTHVSITARPFFEKRGYMIVRKQEVVRAGVTLENFLMEKC
ncbi:MAG: GNAT family N-acetyltransferase [Peptococcaceae bacterium]|nr:GNAT family N-acetyltransferase [Peptococcaceae bacterium]